MIKNRVKVALSKDLRKKYGLRSFPVVKGDIVTVKSGALKGEGGKVVEVDHRYSLVSVEGITATKADGKAVETWLRPEKLRIQRFDLSRKDRIEQLKNLAAKKKIAIEEQIEEDRREQEEESKRAEEEEVEEGTSSGENEEAEEVIPVDEDEDSTEDMAQDSGEEAENVKEDNDHDTEN